VPHLSMLGEALLKDTVLLGASLLTAGDSLRAARTDNRS
jgi:reactive chlorine resistance protein C